MKKKLSYIFILTIIILLISINFYWVKPLLPGFDTPFYLIEIKRFLNGLPEFFSYRYSDRYLSILFPTLISKIFHLDPIISLRIAFSTIYTFIGFSSYYLFKNVTKNNLASLALSTSLIISPFMITYGTLLYAQFAGFLVMLTFFAIETAKKFKYKPAVLVFVYLLIFVTHNFSSVVMTVILVSYYCFKLVSKQKKVISIWMLAFYILLSFGGLLCISRNCHAGIISIPGSPAFLGDEIKRTISSLVEHSGKYWLIFFPAFTMATLVFFKREIVTERKKFILPLSILVPSLIFSFQTYFNLNYLPERFITFLVLSSFFFYAALITLPALKKHLISLSLIPLMLSYLSSDVLIMDKGYRSYSQDEITFYHRIDNIIPKNSLLLISSDQKYWSKYYLEDHRIEAGNSLVACNYIATDEIIGKTSYTIAKLLVETDESQANQYLAEIKSIFPDDKLYILGNEKSCAHGKILENLQTLTNISSLGNYSFYEVN